MTDEEMLAAKWQRHADAVGALGGKATVKQVAAHLSASLGPTYAYLEGAWRRGLLNRESVIHANRRKYVYESLAGGAPTQKGE